MKKQSFTLVEILVAVTIIMTLVTFAFMFLNTYRDLAINQQDTTHATLLSDSAYEYIVYKRNKVYYDCQIKREKELEQWPLSECGTELEPKDWLEWSPSEGCTDSGCHISEIEDKIYIFNKQKIGSFTRKIVIVPSGSEIELADVVITVNNGTENISIRKYILYNWFFSNHG